MYDNDIPPRKRLSTDNEIKGGNLTGFSRRKINQNEEMNFSNTTNLKKEKEDEKIPSFLENSILSNRKSSNLENNINDSFNKNQNNIIRKKIPIVQENNLRISTSSSNADNNSLRNNQINTKKEKIRNTNLANLGLASALGGLVVNEENSKKKIELLIEELNKEKESHLKDIEEYKKLLKEKEDECKKKIERIKSQNLNIENNFFNEDLYKEKEQSLNNEIIRLKNEINEKVNNERERLNNIHKNEMEEQEIKIKQLLEDQKKNFENQNDILKKQLEQQIEFNKLKLQVENSSKQIEQIVNKLSDEKKEQSQYQVNYKNNLEMLEERLKQMEKNLIIDRERYMKDKENFEKEQIEKRKFNSEESSRIKQELIKLEQLQETLKINQFENKKKKKK